MRLAGVGDALDGLAHDEGHATLGETVSNLGVIWVSGHY
jgi:hypothetical protein